ncbi:maleylacetoacetate isomerase [Sarocladium implicatum]|nr:maleylacetoacetate isomerase [Sarocladium implicatum]
MSLKGISYTPVAVDLSNDEHLSSTHKKLNPSASVPLLIQMTSKGTTSIGQSLAAIEYLVEAHSDSGEALLPPPSDLRGRAAVRTLANIIACDNQPVTNVRIMKRVSALGGDTEEWNRGLMLESLAAYEAIASASAGTYSYQDQLSIADVCLVPAIWNARRFKVDLSNFPTILRIMANMEGLDAVKEAHPSVQSDTPSEYRHVV